MPTKSTTARCALAALFAFSIVLVFSGAARRFDRQYAAFTARPGHVSEPVSLLVLGSGLVLAGRSIKRRSAAPAVE